jgi:hypothetical protein
MNSSQLEIASAAGADFASNRHRFCFASGIAVLFASLLVSGCGSGGGHKSISVSVSASSTIVDGSNSITITASVINDNGASGVSWGLSGAGALSNQTANSVTYTAPAATTSSATATITATAVADSSQSSTVKITIPAKPSITTTALNAGNVGATYSVQLSASGGISPYAWQLSSGTLPSCLALSSAGVLSSSSGLMASCVGTADLTFQVTDSGKPNALTATASMSLVINPAPVITFAGSMPTVATNGIPYRGSAAATGGAGALTYTVLTGTLPSGLSLNASTGAVTGTPDGLGTASFAIKAADVFGDAMSNAYQVTVSTQLNLNATNLPLTGVINAAYTGTILASGGSGNYTWQVTGLPRDGLNAATSGNTLTISGMPTSADTVTVIVNLADALTQASTNQTYNIVIGTPTPVSLPAPNPASLPAATLDQPYSGSIIATGGVGPYSWTINGAAVTVTGLAISNSLMASNAGSETLSISGTPATTNTVALTNVKVTDSLGAHATQTYTITVYNTTAQLRGTIALASYCGGAVTPFPPVTLTLSTTPPMQATSDSKGLFTFANVPDGTYTVTPSISGSPDGPSAIFQPATQQVTVANGHASPIYFTMQLGFTVSGTVTYSGAVTGQTYVNLVSGCNIAFGISLSEAQLTSGGAFTIHGVPPGQYTLQAWLDPATLANGSQNDADPSGKSAGLTVSTVNVTGASVTMTEPQVTAPASAPGLRALNPTNSGAAITFWGGSVTDLATRKEAFSSYMVQWSTDSAFSGTPSSAQFKAIGVNYNVWILNNGNSGMNGSLTPGTAYYFRVRGSNAAGDSNWSYWGGPNSVCASSTCAIAVTIGEPSNSGYATVTGHVTITSEMTTNPTGPLYVGYYDPATRAVFGYSIANPIVGTNDFAVSVLKSATTGYIPLGILDQNKDGLIDAGDINNLSDNATPVIINGDMTGMIELSYLYDRVRILTSFYHNILPNGSPYDAYDLKFTIAPVNKLPVAVQLISGPNVITPVDIGNYCFVCNNAQFSNTVFLGGATPTTADMYTFEITYSDGSTMEDGGQVYGWNNKPSVATVNNVPMNLSPVGIVPGLVTPNFTWTYASDAADIQWRFMLSCGPDGLVWIVPGSKSSNTWFTPAQIPGSLAWGVDPTDNTNLPNPSPLSIGTSYTWALSGTDSWGNTVVSETSFTP